MEKKQFFETLKKFKTTIALALLTYFFLARAVTLQSLPSINLMRLKRH
jgi:hypothetical protein